MCAAGLEGSTADDVAKEVAIYRAHKASPIVIATDGQARFAAALHVISVPVDPPAARLRAHRHGRPPLRLRGRAGHRRAGPPAARGPRRHRGRGRRATPSPTARPAPRRCGPPSPPRPPGSSTACAAAPTTATSRRAPPCGWRRRTATPSASPRSTPTRPSTGRIGTPAVVVDDLTAALTQGIEELTRPVDAIKHQAKTVTVGISRSDETLLQPPLVQAVLAAGAPRDRLSYKTLRTLADLDPGRRRGHRLDPLRDRRRSGGRRGARRRSSTAAASRSTSPRAPSGPACCAAPSTRVAVERQVFVTRGREDGRTDRHRARDEGRPGHRRSRCCTSASRTTWPWPAARGALQGYRNRWSALRDAVLETEPTFREDLLADGAGRRPARRADPRAGRPLAPIAP